MTKAAKAVLADALRLGPDERAELAVEVLASLDGPADADAESAWEREISRRIHAIDAGAVELEPWADVKRRIEKETVSRLTSDDIRIIAFAHLKRRPDFWRHRR